jgi:hypothetical protein
MFEKNLISSKMHYSDFKVNIFINFLKIKNPNEILRVDFDALFDYYLV